MKLKIVNRLQKLHQSLAEKEIDGILISQPENRHYLSGFDGSAGYLLITAQDKILATDFRYLEQARVQAADYDIFPITSDIAAWLPEFIANFDLRTLGFEAGHVTFAAYRQLSDILDKAHPKIRLTATNGLVESLRSIKEPGEIELIQEAAEITDKAAYHIRNLASLGMREIDLAWEIEKFLREQGSEILPFEPIVASGTNSALPHARPSQRALHHGEPVIIDIGARCGGYSSDLSRTIWLGDPDETLTKIYDIVLSAQLAAISMITEGMTGGEADNLARTVIEETGYGQEFGHGLGHGIGLAPHESPRLGLKSEDVLTNGMVFTIEPGIYLAGWGGVRIEDVAVMEEGKLKVISKARKVYHDR